MKKLLFLIMMFVSYQSGIYSQEKTLSLGFQGSFGLMSGTSSKIVRNNVDVTSLTNVEYEKSLIGAGFNLTGKFSGSTGWGGMGKIYSIFPLSYTHEIKISNAYSILRQSSGTETLTNFDPGFLIGFGGGAVKRFVFNEKLVLAIDFGLECRIDIIGIDLYHLFIINAGMFADANLEYHLNRHFYFDFGMNYEMLLGAGIYGYQKTNIQVSTGEFAFFVSPCISAGYRF